MPAREVVRQTARVLLAEAAQIDDATDARHRGIRLAQLGLEARHGAARGLELGGEPGNRAFTIAGEQLHREASGLERCNDLGRIIAG